MKLHTRGNNSPFSITLSCRTKGQRDTKGQLIKSPVWRQNCMKSLLKGWHSIKSQIWFLCSKCSSLSLNVSGSRTASCTQWMKLSRSVVSDSCDPMDYSLPVSSVHGILQARILESVAVLFARGSSQPRDWTQVSCIAGGFFTNWATRKVVAAYNNTGLLPDNSGGQKSSLRFHAAKSRCGQVCVPFWRL